MEHVALRLGLTTVGDLARVHPASLLLERNLGRKTVSETRAIVERVLGMRWEDAASPPDDEDDDERTVSEAFDPATLGWDGLSVVLPEALKARAVLAAPLPARLVSYAASQRIETVGALVKVPRLTLEDAPNLGRRTLQDATATLLALRAALVEQGPVVATDWKRHFVESLAKLPMRERLVLTQRAALVGPPPTLAELGESLGVSRERVRQLEAHALQKLRQESVWVEPLAASLGAVCPPFVARLADVMLGGVPLVASPEADGDAFSVLLEGVLEGRAGHLVEHDGTAYYGRATADFFAKKLARITWVCESLVYPVDTSTLHDRLRLSADVTHDELAVLFDLVRGGFVEEGGKIVGYGADRGDAVIAFLRAAGRPVPIAEVHATFGRTKLPEGVAWVDRGLVTLPELVPDYHLWRERVGPLVTGLMAENGQERPWSTAELLPLLGTLADLPEWMNPYALGSLLRGAEKLAHMGRNVVALAEAGAGERAHLDETMEDELGKAGAPLAEEELLLRVRARRTVTDLAWNATRVRAPFVMFDDGRIGLYPRDVPGGEGATKVLRDAAAEWLEQREEGAGIADLRAFVGSLGAPRGDFDARLVRSLLRHDGRFRLSHGGGLGLAAWGETRTKTQREVLEELLDAGGGRALVADAVAALPTASGEPIPRVRLGMLAAQVGARLAGDTLVRESPLPPSVEHVTATEESWLVRVPEKAVPTLERFLRSAREVPALKKAVNAWREGMLKLVGYPVDRAQVARVATMADEVLARAAVADDADWARCARAAVEYVVCVEDGESDLVVGGLDDDEGVLRVVRGS